MNKREAEENMLCMGLLIFAISSVSIFVFIKTGYYMFHPAICILAIIMGLGWSLTAIISMKSD